MTKMNAPDVKAAFESDNNTKFHAAGFMLDDQGRAKLLLSYAGTRTNGAHYKTENYSGYHAIVLSEMEKIADKFQEDFGPDKNIFSSSPEAVAREKSLGYVCYQMFRRLRRLEETWAGNLDGYSSHKKMDYTVPLDLKWASDIIRQALSGNFDLQTGFLTDPRFANDQKTETPVIRRSDIPLASDYDRSRALNVSQIESKPAVLKAA